MAERIPIAIIVGEDKSFIDHNVFPRLTHYIPRLAGSTRLLVKAIWCPTEESPSFRGAFGIAIQYFPEVECMSGAAARDQIIADNSIRGVILLSTGQDQVNMALDFLRAGKHVLQEKPTLDASGDGSVEREFENAVAGYNAIGANRPLWTKPENYRFEPAFAECNDLIPRIGRMRSVQMIVEGSTMDPLSPYYMGHWPWFLLGSFIMDLGIDLLDGLRMIVGSEVVSVSAAPDKIQSSIQLENRCSGVFSIYSSTAPKIFWQVEGSYGMLRIERVNRYGTHGYQFSISLANGYNRCTFSPLCGIDQQLDHFIRAISAPEGSDYTVDTHTYLVEVFRNVAVLKAMSESEANFRTSVNVQRFTLDQHA